VNAEFNWWLLIVGLVIGAALVWLVLADSSRREAEITEEELPREATWIAATMQERGEPLTPEAAEEMLRLHRAYLASLPPDEDEDVWAEEGAETTEIGDGEEPRTEARRSARVESDIDRPISPLARPPRGEQPSPGRGAGS
jgi:hypothetical protein